jgi:hypothetical protein
LLPQESRIATVIKYAKSLTGQASEELFALVESTRQLMEERNP